LRRGEGGGMSTPDHSRRGGGRTPQLPAGPAVAAVDLICSHPLDDVIHTASQQPMGCMEKLFASDAVQSSAV